MNPLLEVRTLGVNFLLKGKTLKAVNDVSFTIDEGKVLGLVGESGSGKTMTALSLMNMVPRPGRIVGGQVLFMGEDLLNKSDKEIREIRGNEISMIFQDPLTSLNPTLTVGEQIMETIQTHQGVSRQSAMENSIEMIRKVGIASPEKVIHSYPHEFSGGMRQRIMIAMALCCKPKLLLADEPTTALDVTIQAQVLKLMRELKTEYGMGMLLITHSLGVVAQMADYVAVMYAGKIVEYGDVYNVFQAPLHPYTQALLRAIPNTKKQQPRLHTIEGTVPDLTEIPSGCAFHPRCERVLEICSSKEPLLEDKNHLVACHAV